MRKKTLIAKWIEVGACTFVHYNVVVYSSLTMNISLFSLLYSVPYHFDFIENYAWANQLRLHFFCLLHSILCVCVCLPRWNAIIRSTSSSQIACAERTKVQATFRNNSERCFYIVFFAAVKSHDDAITCFDTQIVIKHKNIFINSKINKTKIVLKYMIEVRFRPSYFFDIILNMKTFMARKRMA